MSLTAGAGWDLISPRTAPTARTKPSEHDTKHIQNVKDQIRTLCTMHQRWVLSLFKNGEDAVNAKHEHETGEPSFWVVSRIYREGICDIAGETIGYGLECSFNHLSILSLCVFFSLSFHALSCVLRFSLLVALWGLFSFVVFSEGKGNERRESNSQRWCLLVGDALSPVGVRYDVRCDPSGHPPHLHKPPNLCNVSDLLVGAR